MFKANNPLEVEEMKKIDIEIETINWIIARPAAYIQGVDNMLEKEDENHE